MGALRREAFDELLAEVAAPTPAPGGGSSAACACALAAALVEMAAGIEAARADSPLDGDLPARVGLLRERGLELAERELSSYDPVLAARRLPRDDPAREERLEAALAEASEPPLAVAEAAAEVAELGARVAAVAAPAVRGDAVAGAILAEAAAAAAAGLVDANLQTGSAAGAPLRERARAASERAAAARAQAMRRPISEAS